MAEWNWFTGELAVTALWCVCVNAAADDGEGAYCVDRQDRRLHDLPQQRLAEHADRHRKVFRDEHTGPGRQRRFCQLRFCI